MIPPNKRIGSFNEAIMDEPAHVELVNAKELARILSVSERTLYRLKSTGELPLPIVLGGSVRWRLSEIRHWIDQGCPRPVKPK